MCNKLHRDCFPSLTVRKRFFFFSPSCISIYHNAKKKKKKRAKTVLYFHLEQQHLDSPKDSNCSNHEKVILCASVVPFIQASHSTLQTLAPILRGPRAHGSSYTGIYSAGFSKSGRRGSAGLRSRSPPRSPTQLLHQHSPVHPEVFVDI